MKKMTQRELDLMRVLWEADKPLTAAEMAERNGCSMDSVQTVLKSLLKVELIEVGEYIFKENVKTRTFKPTFSEFALIQQELENTVSKDITASRLAAALIPKDNKEDALKELDRLEEMIYEYRQSMQKDTEW